MKSKYINNELNKLIYNIDEMEIFEGADLLESNYEYHKFYEFLKEEYENAKLEDDFNENDPKFMIYKRMEAAIKNKSIPDIEKEKKYRLKTLKKTKELLKTVKEIHKLPVLKDNGIDKVYFFEDGKNQRAFYKKLEKSYNDAYLKDVPKSDWELTSREIFDINIYIFINSVVSEESKVLININKKELEILEEKSSKFIETVSKLKRLPELNEEFFEDGTCQRNFYEQLKEEILTYSKTKSRDAYFCSRKWQLNGCLNKINNSISSIYSEESKKYVKKV